MLQHLTQKRGKLSNKEVNIQLKTYFLGFFITILHHSPEHPSGTGCIS